MTTPTTTELLYLAREARETYFALGRAFQLTPSRQERAVRRAYRRWARRQAMLERAIQEEIERA